MHNGDVSADVVEERNANYLVWSHSLQNFADQLVSAKTVLPWLLNLAGVPAFVVGLLVPIRESGSMLPQAPLSAWISSQPSRKRLWILSSLAQAGFVGGIALAAALLHGVVLGVVTLVLLAGFALSRSLSSLAGKDIQGRTISKGRRGRISGRATQIGGAITLLVGGLLAAVGHTSKSVLIALVITGGCMWVFASITFYRIVEPAPTARDARAGRWWKDTWDLFATNRQFRMFVVVRSLMLVTALSTAFIVLLSKSAAGNLATLGGFVVSAGLAGLVGGRISGLLSDISSRLVLSYASLGTSVVIVGLVVSAHTLPDAANRWIIPGGFFLVSLLHTAIRVARKTYVVDMADNDNRTRYVGAANSLMGVNLLFIGGLSSLIALAGPSAALCFLALMGGVGSLLARQLAEVSARG